MDCHRQHRRYQDAGAPPVCIRALQYSLRVHHQTNRPRLLVNPPVFDAHAQAANAAVREALLLNNNIGTVCPETLRYKTWEWSVQALVLTERC